MSDANELAKFIAGYLQTVCDSHICAECPFFSSAHEEVCHCKIFYANYILEAKGLEALW